MDWKRIRISKGGGLTLIKNKGGTEKEGCGRVEKDKERQMRV